ncbi:MAG: YusW family protein [Lysinibacillus sp.]
MKKISVLLTVPLLLGALYGCNKDKVEDVPAKAPVEQEDERNALQDNKTEDLIFAFTHFSLDVDYTATEFYEAEYENEKTGMEAEIKDSRNGEELFGDKAFTKLEPLFKQLNFDKETPDEEVISQVISVFNISDDYKEFDLDVKFSDGTEKEYKSVK